MKKSTLNALGGMQSVLFCVGIYVVALFFSIFVCSSVFYAFRSNNAEVTEVAKAAPAPSVNKQVLASIK
jgi:hypothetical protein